jgi:hypothetical protein
MPLRIKPGAGSPNRLFFYTQRGLKTAYHCQNTSLMGSFS